mmetsp:Transcript_41939/g.90943  ORF Transcript_41939/g.90943 Transcript_41939/m.90943 type:complete len:209 (+) Transcript_41939:211-837(+)
MVAPLQNVAFHDWLGQSHCRLKAHDQNHPVLRHLAAHTQVLRNSSKHLHVDVWEEGNWHIQVGFTAHGLKTVQHLIGLSHRIIRSEEPYLSGAALNVQPATREALNLGDYGPLVLGHPGSHHLSPGRYRQPLPRACHAFHPESDHLDGFQVSAHHQTSIRFLKLHMAIRNAFLDLLKLATAATMEAAQQGIFEANLHRQENWRYTRKR